MKKRIIAGVMLVACIMCSITACKKKESNISWNHMNDTDSEKNTVTGESDIVKNITSQLQLVLLRHSCNLFYQILIQKKKKGYLEKLLSNYTNKI